jgi:hypothetical protein
MIYEIRPIAEDHIPSFRETLDEVAREQKFLSFLEAPPNQNPTGLGERFA